MQLDIDAAMVLIKSNKRVVVVGLSPKEDRPSHRVGKFLIEKGFVVTPINPGQDEILGQECKKSLAEAISLILEGRREDALRGVPADAKRETITISGNAKPF